MQIFEAISKSQSFTVPKNTYDLKIVYDAITRLGAKITTQIKILYRKTNFEHSTNLYGVDLINKIKADLDVLQSMYKRYRVLLLNFIDKSTIRLNTDNPKIIYTSYMHDFSIELGFPYQFAGTDVNIKTNDVFWR